MGKRTIYRDLFADRKEANITQAELSERVGVSHEFIRRIESPKGAKTFSVDTLYKISIALKTNCARFKKIPPYMNFLHF